MVYKTTRRYLISKFQTRHIYTVFFFFFFFRNDCQTQVNGFGGAIFKKFKSQQEAQQFVDGQPPNKKFKASKRSDPISKAKKSILLDDLSSKNAYPKRLTEQEEIDDIANCAFDSDEDKFLKLTEYPDDEPVADKSRAESTRKNVFDMKYESPLETKEKIYSGLTFHEDSKGFVHVYTDGSCENNGKRGAAAGLGVYFGESHELNLSEPVKGRATNNVGEIQAAVRAIEEAQKCGIKRLKIYTDSQFLIKSICCWMNAWKSRNWKLSSGKPIANEIDFKNLDKLIESGNTLIEWKYIPAHRGYRGNEAADQLAKAGATRYPNQAYKII